MLNVEVDAKQAVDIRTQSGTSKNGKPYSMQLQRCWLALPDSAYPREIEIVVERPYPQGRYGLNLDTQVFVGAFNGLKLPSELLLVPVQQKAA